MALMLDQDLLREFSRNGCNQAFGCIVERYSGLVFGVAMRCTHDRQIAEEVAQNVFLILARKSKSLEPGKLAGWLHRTAVLESRNLNRKEANTKRKEAALIQFEVDETEGSRDSIDEVGPLLDEAIDSLSSKEHTALSLRFFDEKSYKDIGKVLGKSEEAVRKLLTRALEKLRRNLQRKGFMLSTTALSAFLAHDVAKADAPPGFSQELTTQITSDVVSPTNPMAIIPESAIASKVPFYTGVAILFAAVIAVAMMTTSEDRGLTIEDLIRLSKLTSQTAFGKEVERHGFKFVRAEGVPESYVYQSDRTLTATSEVPIQVPHDLSFKTENGISIVTLTTAQKHQFDPLHQQLLEGDNQFRSQSTKTHPVMEGSMTTFTSSTLPNIRIVVRETVMNQNDPDGTITSWDSYGIQVINETPRKPADR